MGCIQETVVLQVQEDVRPFCMYNKETRYFELPSPERLASMHIVVCTCTAAGTSLPLPLVRHLHLHLRCRWYVTCTCTCAAAGTSPAPALQLVRQPAPALQLVRHPAPAPALLLRGNWQPLCHSCRHKLTAGMHATVCSSVHKRLCKHASGVLRLHCLSCTLRYTCLCVHVCVRVCMPFQSCRSIFLQQAQECRYAAGGGLWDFLPGAEATSPWRQDWAGAQSPGVHACHD